MKVSGALRVACATLVCLGARPLRVARRGMTFVSPSSGRTTGVYGSGRGEVCSLSEQQSHRRPRWGVYSSPYCERSRRRRRACVSAQLAASSPSAVSAAWARSPRATRRPFKVAESPVEIEPVEEANPVDEATTTTTTTSSEGDKQPTSGVESEEEEATTPSGPTRVPRRKVLAEPWLAPEEEYDEGESYETKWRRRRMSALKTAGELSPVELEDLFEPDYLQKRLWSQQPNAAFGAVFKLEGVVCDVDVLPTFEEAWKTVAEEFSVEPPDQSAVSYALNQALRDEVAIERVFRWTRDWGEARKMSLRYGEILAESFDELDIEPRPGVDAWLGDLRKEGVPCAVVTKIPIKMLDACLDKLGYADYFDVHTRAVTAEDERDRADQAFLHASLLLERRPSRCVVFSDTVQDLIGAHEADMRAVAVLGAHPAYELQVADLVVRDCTDLRLANVRRLFADVDFDPVQLELELETEPHRRLTATLPQDDLFYDPYYDDDDDY